MRKRYSFDKDALFEACKKVVSQTLWLNPESQDISDIIDSDQIKRTTLKYLEEALRHGEFIIEQDMILI